MIFWDWFSHVLYGLGYTNFFLYRYFAEFVRFVGWSNFWVAYWGIALILMLLILNESVVTLKNNTKPKGL